MDPVEQKDTLPKRGKNRIWNSIATIIKICGGATIVFKFAFFLYKGYLIKPNIVYEKKGNQLVFSVEEDYRSMAIKLHPQMVIQFDNHIILLIYLNEYFAEDYLFFNRDKQVTADMSHTEYVNKLKRYMRKEIVHRLCINNPDASEDEINKRLKIYVSIVGGVRYESKKGNEEKRYCIIEKDGIIRDLDDDAKEIVNRLFETELVMGDDLTDIETEDKIDDIVQGITEEISLFY